MIRGVRKMISFDGAQISVGRPRPASSASTRASSGRGCRCAPPRTSGCGRPGPTGISLRRQPRRPGSRSQGTTPAISSPAPRKYSVRYGGAAQLGITGVDLVVNQAISRKLGLVHQVAALISAPGLDIAATDRQGRARARTGRPPGRPARPSRTRAPTPASITDYLQLFQASAAKYCPALSWTVLAAIGQIESADGQNVGPSSAGALGPMQFLPSTWAELGDRRIRTCWHARHDEPVRCRAVRGEDALR